MQRSQTARPVESPPQGLAIDGNDLVVSRRCRGRLPSLLKPSDQTALQRQRTDSLEDPPKGIMGRNAVGKFEKAPEEALLRPAELLDLDEVIATAQHSAEADQQHIDQTMPQILT